jgi:galactose-1-phosphate uridylyltransferase
VQGGFCPFCPENVERVTPKFPQDVVPEGRMRRGEAVLFPNLSPYAEFSAVTVVCADHSPTLGELTPEKVADAVRLSLDFLATVCRGRPDLHPFVCWNYLPPAGASQPHPHLQPFASTVPGNALGAELRAERAYREEEGRSFWADLLKEEKVCGERYLGRIGGTEWVVAFRPRGALGEVIGLFPEGQSLVYLGEELVRDVAVGLTRLFAFMQASNLFSFNLVLYQGGEGARLRFIPRFYIQPALHASDVNFLLMGCGEPLAVITPEDVAARIRPFFNS